MKVEGGWNEGFLGVFGHKFGWLKRAFGWTACIEFDLSADIGQTKYSVYPIN